ncbi:chitinase [Streptomyces cellostaticus]|uniref:chitinase n=1 Tax=Streptomyces cellostaticus TaxID=67285 RepID=UPI0020275CFA|nr:chitinase [Streptomyces cellostaticus]
MRKSPILAAVSICLFALAVTGCSAQRHTGSTASAEPTEHVAPVTSYAPYVSATDDSDTDTSGSPTTLNLAFVISDSDNCTPTWDGTSSIGSTTVKSRINRLKRNGATVRVSFGGADGTELARACDSASALAAAYGEALDAAGSEQADFDIEGDTLTDSASVNRRSAAIALLQHERRGLEVTFTLPVMPSGLDSDAVALLESANEHDVQVSTVNIMAMNYGASYDDDMGDYAIAAAEATQRQLKEVFGLSDAMAWRGMALTAMLGVNDAAGETFTLSDAGQVRTFAEERQIGWVSMWATFRDRQCEDGNSEQNDPATDCSGVKQGTGTFSEAFGGH